MKINKHTQTKEHQGFTWFDFWLTSTGNDEEIPLTKILSGDIQVGVSIFSHTPNPQYPQYTQNQRTFPIICTSQSHYFTLYFLLYNCRNTYVLFIHRVSRLGDHCLCIRVVVGYQYIG